MVAEINTWGKNSEHYKIVAIKDSQTATRVLLASYYTG